MLVILAAFAVLYAQFFIYMIPLLILMGVTLPQYCCAWIYNWIFRRIDGEIDAKGRKVAQYPILQNRTTGTYFWVRECPFLPNRITTGQSGALE